MKLTKQIIIYGVTPFLDLYEVCMFNNVIPLQEMYKHIVFANIYEHTNIPRLVAKCPGLTSLYICREFVREKEETGEENKDARDLDLLCTLKIERLVYAFGFECVYPLEKFPHLKYLEADKIYLRKDDPMLEEVKFNYVYMKKGAEANIKKAHGRYDCMLQSRESQKMLNYVSIDLHFAGTSPAYNSSDSDDDYENVKIGADYVDKANDVLRELSTMPLTSLSFKYIEGVDLNILASLKLKELDLTGMEPPESFQHMPVTRLSIAKYSYPQIQFKQLKMLTLHEVTLDINDIEVFPLETLVMYDSEITRMHKLTKFPLKNLTLTHMEFDARICNMKLEKLHFSRVNCEKKIRPRNVKSYKLDECDGLNVDLTELPPTITKLFINDRIVSMREIIHISTLPITELTLNKCRITDEMMLYIGKLDLQHLSIESNYVTNLGIECLRGKRLRSLMCDKMSVCQLLKN